MNDDNHRLAAFLFHKINEAPAANARLEPVGGGLSDADVFRVMNDPPVRYLKMARGNAAAALRDEMSRAAWLSRHSIPVPYILGSAAGDGPFAVLMSAVPGVRADVSPLPAPLLADALGKALAALHAVPADDCPFNESLAVRFERAGLAVAAGKVDPAAFEPRNSGVTPAALLTRLVANPPVTNDSVVVHGDATLNNLMIVDSGAVGFVDCGNAGRGDRYVDLALLAADLEAHHGAEAAARFIDAYGERNWDADKAAFYLDLYELF
jgi:aminoglycoside phosphotransferase